ncbi:MAG: hypothetical protein HS119_00090 [Flavobacteriales bacterium]|nr:hypothetical protein [Flavobacteriales bacterium]
MKLQTKKIIAREFLVLTITIVIGLIAFALTYPYNLYRHNQVGNLEKTISEKTTLSDSLSKSFESKKEKRNWLGEKCAKEVDVNPDTTYINDLWKILEALYQKDSLAIRWNTKWKVSGWDLIFTKIGFQNPDSLKKFVELNIITNNEVDNKNSSIKINQEINILNLQKKRNRI